MPFRRGRYHDVVRRQLALFEEEHAGLISDCVAAERAYDRAERDEAEEKYGDYLDLVETATELLAGIRDHFARPLEQDAAYEYVYEFNRAVAKRWPRFGAEIEDI